MVADNHGGSTSQVVTVVITGANDAPVAQASLIAINPEQAVSSRLVAIDPDAGDVLTYAVVTGPAHGTLTLQANGQYGFKAAVGFTGSDSFVYSATDASGASSTATVQIQVAPYVGQVIPIPYAPSGAADTRVSTMPTVDTNQVAALTNGGDLVVWAALGGSDTDGAGIYAQRYDATGNPAGATVQANTTTLGNQVHPTVAGLSNGTSVVVWESDAVGTGRVIQFQMFDAAGNKLGAERLVAAPEAGDRLFPSVTSLAGGGFAVTWQGYDEANQTNGFDIYARTFNADGSARSGTVTVNPATAGDQQNFADLVRTAAGLKDGRVVITWLDLSGADGSGAGVFARILNADGTASSGAFQVNTVTAGSQTYGAVGALNDGGFVVAWQDPALGIELQRYSAAGVAVGTQVQVSTFNNGAQQYAQVSALGDGGYAVLWQSLNDDGSTGWQVAGQRFAANGSAVGGEFIVNSSLTGSHELPSVALRADGALIATWRDENAPAAIVQKIITDFGTHISPKTIAGTSGNDVIYGGDGQDTLSGGAGDDLIVGGGGADMLTGGGGADHFLYQALGDSTLAAADVITDFSATDKLDFAAALGLTTVRATDLLSATTLQAHTVAFHTDATKTTVYANLGGSTESLTNGADVMKIVLTGTQSFSTGSVNISA